MKTKIVLLGLSLLALMILVLAFRQNTPLFVEKEAFPWIFTLQVDKNKPSYFGILGESRSKDFAEEPFNSAVLKQLFEALNTKKVKGIFFDGNLFSGVKKGNDLQSEPIDYKELKEDLTRFSKFYHEIFNPGVPLYPVLGDREVSIHGSANLIVNHFHLSGAIIQKNTFLYAVSAGNAYFVVIGTDELNEENGSLERTYSPFMLDWLKTALTEGAKKHQYLFVIGFEPAFPSATTFSKIRIPHSDAFWKILSDYKVLAYFSSKEHLFDRSNRLGVWQIISGGGGAPFSEGGGTKPFFHSLVLTIPGEKKDKTREHPNPVIQVIDVEGKVIEEFNLNSENQPLFQMRIT